VQRHELGKIIRQARNAKNLSQDRLAELVGAKGGRQTVIRWEQGQNRPTEFVDALADTLDLDAALFRDEDDAPFPGGRGGHGGRRAA